jgi:hypothetical protein
VTVQHGVAIPGPRLVAIYITSGGIPTELSTRFTPLSLRYRNAYVPTANQFVLERRVDPCMSDAWSKILYAHELMRTNRHPPSNMAVLVNAPRTKLCTLDVVEVSAG